MLTEKENLMRIYRNEKPEWVPRYGYASPGKAPACLRVQPSFLNAYRQGSGGFDVWGVEYVGTKEMGGQALPVPGKYLVKDITKWREVLKKPDLHKIDWESMAAKDMAHIDRTQTAVMGAMHSGYFQVLVNMMGYEEGCLAMYDEPEEVKAMLTYISDFYIEVEENLMKYYKPDLFNITDDCATAKQPFISHKMYQEFIKPFHEREAAIARREGIPIDMHCCGVCDSFFDDWLEMGVRSWQPAQVMNDLPTIQKKYGNKLIFMGCWDSQGPAGWNDTSEDIVKDEVRKCIETYAADGSFIFWASSYGMPDDPEFINKAKWIQEAYDEYGRTCYQR